MANTGRTAEIFGGPLTVEKQSLFELLEEGLLANRHGPAVITVHQPADHLAWLIGGGQKAPKGDESHCLTWTFDQVYNAALRLSVALLARGVRPGGTLVVLVTNGVEYAILLWTSLLLKVTFSALDYGMLTAPRSEELKEVLRMLKPDTVVVLAADDAHAVTDALEKLHQHLPLGIILHGEDQAGSWLNLLDLVGTISVSEQEKENLTMQARTDDPERTWLVLFTSGTSSGQPKGCPVRVDSYLRMQTVDSSLMDLGPRSMLDTACFRAIFPYICLLNWRIGGAIVLPWSKFEPWRSLDTIKAFRVTNLILLPAVLHALAAHPSMSTTDVSSVTYVAMTGDMITKDVMLKAQKMFPNALLQVKYGASEGGIMFSWPFSGTKIEEMPFYGDIAPIGRVATGIRVRLWNHERRQVATRGEPGEMHLCSESTIRGYLGSGHKEVFYKDDVGLWYNTGDLALMTEDGLMYILGRVKDVIMRAGIPITPAALESTIQDFVACSAVVVAIPHLTLGQEPFAVVDEFNGQTEASIEAQVLRKFGKDYALRGVASLGQLRLAGWPLNSTGKIMKIDVHKAVTTYLKGHNESL